MKKIHSVLTGILIVALLCPAAMAAEPEVTEEQWQAIDFVFDHGILQSDPTGAFQPHQPVSRAQMVGALYEMEGRPDVDTRESRPCYGGLYSRRVRPCFREDEGRQRRQNAGIY